MRFTAYLLKSNEVKLYYTFAPYFRHIYIYILKMDPVVLRYLKYYKYYLNIATHSNLEKE